MPNLDNTKALRQSEVALCCFSSMLTNVKIDFKSKNVI